jgi:hypothetical protein
MLAQTHLLVRVVEGGRWEVRSFGGQDSLHDTLDEALEHGERLLLEGDDTMSSMQIQRWNGLTETRIYQRMAYTVNPLTDPVFNNSMELR